LQHLIFQQFDHDSFSSFDYMKNSIKGNG